MQYNPLNKRVTIFANKSLIFDEKNITAFINEFLDMKLIPSISKGYQVKLIPNDRYVGEEVMTLNLKRLDDSIMVEFNPDRVDIISRDEKMSWEDFYGEAMNILDRLVDNLNIKFSRVAIGCTIRYILGTELLCAAYHKLVFSSVEDAPVEWNIRKVVRTSFKSDKDDIYLNNVYTLNMSEADCESLNLELDFNTVANSDVEAVTFNRKMIGHDFMKSIKDGIDHYNMLFESWK